jgi:hypothetical protein
MTGRNPQEIERKVMHDRLLAQDVGERCEFEWGHASSVLDQKGGGSLIVIEYRREFVE